MCAKQGVLADLCERLSRELGGRSQRPPDLPRAGIYALHLHDRDGLRLSHAERLVGTN